MGHRNREDTPGSRHHITNRGVAQRIIFRDQRDIRFLLSCIAREVRRGTIQVLAFAILTNHFHLLVVSLTGELSEAMQRIQNRYSKYFNRRYGRDGPLFRSRFRSKKVGDLAYMKAVIRYIDRNAVQARLAATPWEYPWGSAAGYVHGKQPIWMRNEAVPGIVTATVGVDQYSGDAYRAFYERCRHEDVAALVESKLARTGAGVEMTDDLVNAAPEVVRDWMIRMTRHADGRFLGDPVCSPQTVVDSLSSVSIEVAASKKRKATPADALKAGLLRLVAGCRWGELSALVGKPESTCRRLVKWHLSLLESDEGYSKTAGTVVRGLLFRAGTM